MIRRGAREARCSAADARSIVGDPRAALAAIARGPRHRRDPPAERRLRRLRRRSRRHRRPSSCRGALRAGRASVKCASAAPQRGPVYVPVTIARAAPRRGRGARARRRASRSPRDDFAVEHRAVDGRRLANAVTLVGAHLRAPRAGDRRSPRRMSRRPARSPAAPQVTRRDATWWRSRIRARAHARDRRAPRRARARRASRIAHARPRHASSTADARRRRNHHETPSPCIALVVSPSACATHIAPYKRKRRKFDAGEFGDRAASPRAAACTPGRARPVRGRRSPAASATSSSSKSTRRTSRAASRHQARQVRRDHVRRRRPRSAWSPRCKRSIPTSTRRSCSRPTPSRSFTGAAASTRQGRLSRRCRCASARSCRNGDLFVEGTKVVMVGHEEQHLYLSAASCAAIDIAEDNTVPSSRIADAEIEYTGRGDVSDTQRRGWVSRALSQDLAVLMRALRHPPRCSPARASADRIKDLVTIERRPRQPPHRLRPRDRPRRHRRRRALAGREERARPRCSSGSASRSMPTDLKAKNVAAVMITAELPPFAKPGHDARRHGVVDRQRARASRAARCSRRRSRAPTSAPGRSRRARCRSAASSPRAATGSSAKKNHTLVGTIPRRRAGRGLRRRRMLPRQQLALILKQPDFTTATRMRDAIVAKLGADRRALARRRRP